MFITTHVIDIQKLFNENDLSPCVPARTGVPPVYSVILATTALTRFESSS